MMDRQHVDHHSLLINEATDIFAEDDLNRLNNFDLCWIG